MNKIKYCSDCVNYRGGSRPGFSFILRPYPACSLWHIKGKKTQFSEDGPTECKHHMTEEEETIQFERIRSKNGKIHMPRMIMIFGPRHSICGLRSDSLNMSHNMEKITCQNCLKIQIGHHEEEIEEEKKSIKEIEGETKALKKRLDYCKIQTFLICQTATKKHQLSIKNHPK